MISPIRLDGEAFPGEAPLGHPGDKWTVTPYYWEIHLLGLGESLRDTPSVLALGFWLRRLVCTPPHPQLLAGQPGSLGPLCAQQMPKG